MRSVALDRGAVAHRIMAGLGEPAVVDLVAQDAEGNALLVIVETRSWGTDVREPQMLRAKIDNYVAFCEQGQLNEMYPQLVGKPVFIQLAHSEPLSPRIAAAIERTTERLKVLGIGFKLQVLKLP